MKAKKIERRELIKKSAMYGSALWLGHSFPTIQAAKPATSKPNFVLYVHAGSFDGFASGLLQPQVAGVFPSGVFVRNAVVKAANPYLMEHTTANGHILHHYNRFLEDVSKNLLHITCVPGSLDHNVARIIQKTGVSTLGSPHWVVGAGQILRDTSAAATYAIADDLEGMNAAAAPNMVAVNAGSIEALRIQLGQPFDGKLPAGAEDQMLEAMRKSFALAKAAQASLLPDTFEATYLATLRTNYKGAPALEPSNAALVAAIAAVNETALVGLIKSKLGANPETEAILDMRAERKADVKLVTQFAEKFQLAAILASSGFSPSMAISMPLQDQHNGGSQVLTARIAAIMWAGLTLFWKFIEMQGLQNNCLCVVTHEFGRTPWNNKTKSYDLNHNSKAVKVIAPGTDHHPVNGVYLLSGKFGRSGRLGGVLPGFAVGGAEEFDAAPSLNVPPPTTLAVVGSALMAAFPEAFRHPGQPESARVVRALWPSFSDSTIIPALRDIL